MTQARIAVSPARFSVGDEYSWLAEHDEDGAVVTFTDKVCNYNLGDSVKAPTLEHYPGMTERSLAEIVNLARERWPLGRVTVIHRIGEVWPREEIVFVGVTSTHRGSAFAVGESITGYLKTHAPFWKREATPEGECWVDARDSDHQVAERWQRDMLTGWNFVNQERAIDRYPRSDSVVQGRTGLQTYTTQVYDWMTVGLLPTVFITWSAANAPAVMMFAFSSKTIFFGLITTQLALVFVLSGMVQRLSAGMVTTLFMLYSMLTEPTLSSIFIIYTYLPIAGAFVATDGMFGAMSLYDYAMKRDLSGFGSMLFMRLVGIVLVSLAKPWLKSETLMWAVTYIGVVLFVGLTAYDTQRLKDIGEQIDTRDNATLRKYSTLGALTLHLDFINLFLMLLRIMGNRRQPLNIRGLHLLTPGKRSAAG